MFFFSLSQGAKFLAALFLLLSLQNCGAVFQADKSGRSPKSAPAPVMVSFNFSQNISAWTVGIADYSAGTTPDDVITAQEPLPAPMNGSGFRLSGTNESDDLFIYIKKQISGLQAGQLYDIEFQVNIVSGEATGCAGVGGSPGDSVWVHAGATTFEPQTILRGEDFRVNIDRGNQSMGGSQGVVLGTIANSKTDCSQNIFEAKLLATHLPHTVTADGAGRVWIHVGIDSGFEAYSEIYLQSMFIILKPS